ncbi:MAG: hypothetical protein HYZ01_06515, partial [Ignavibacteriales bacterium]|nr:hypothetical protein [Ignavibacteriales bacterium]
MKKSLAVLAIAILSLLFIQESNAQASANQTVNLTVSAVYKISTSGNPGALTISNG